jgi:serine/threonine protein kinase/tetratricopeptide (TPR) repeat protein
MTTPTPGFVTAERWTLLEPLLDAALSLTPAQRDAFLDQACAADASLRGELESMLADCERDAPLLELPAADRFSTLSTDVDVARLGATLAGRYALERELGRGGMAIVFLARDLKHHRHVAIKVLEPRDGAAVSSERFLREIAIAARLSHPHILALYDSGEAAGSLYYVMPHVEGLSLRERLRAESQLPVEESVRIAREVAAALDYAHRSGVIHRDIKPDNILLHDGTALVADFGIARATSRASTGEQITAAGLGLGTPSYMSPEQISAPEQIDGRADIYAVGCLLYEMLTGQPPYAGPTAGAVLAQHAGAPVPSARTLRPAVTPALDRVVQRAMAKSPADRFATGAALAEALLAAPGASSAAWAGVPDGPSIAVLPFVNLSADPENEYFSDGVTEEILNALTAITTLKVASRSASFAYKGQHVGAATVAQRLNVRAVLEGSLRRSGNRIRITVQLINASDGYTLWSERYDREVHDVFDIQEEIARTIVDTLRVRLTTVDVDKLGKRQTDNLEAYELYLRGRYCWFRRGMLKRSMNYFQRALEADPDYALAYHGLADGYSVLALYGFAPPGEVVPTAMRAVERAVALAPDLAEVRTSQGFLELLRWNWADADATLSTAIRLNPQYALAYSFQAWLLTTVGREREAEAAARRGQELDPLSPVTNGIAALVAYHRRDYALSIRECERALEIEPSAFLSLLAITLSHSAMGDYEAALEHAREGVRLSPDTLFLHGLLGAVYGMAGLPDAARRVLAELDERSGSAYVAPMLRSWIYSHIGEMDLAFAALEEAYAERSAPLGFGIRFPIYDVMRTDPRFTDILHRMKLQ